MQATYISPLTDFGFKKLFDRKVIFDLNCVSSSGERFVIELQKVKQAYFKDEIRQLRQPG